MQLNPYLTFSEQCEAAFKFYEQCLGGKIAAMMTYEDSSMAKEPKGFSVSLRGCLKSLEGVKFYANRRTMIRIMAR